jgi:hypothetical protein
MTTPESIYSSLNSEEDLKELVASRVKENIVLEYKEKANRSNGDMGDADKENWSKCLSGFSNSGGGVVVWGVEVRRSDDSAKSLKPITRLSRFERSLKKSLIDTVIPFVDGVEIEAIPASEGQDIGFIKCLIPESDKTPHRAMLAGREYFKRSVEGFYRLEHFDLEDMFGRRQRPSLDISPSVEETTWEDAPAVKLEFFLTNNGRAVARYSGFTAHVENATAKHVNTLTDDSPRNPGKTILSYRNDVGVIHPNQIKYSAGHAILVRDPAGTLIVVQVLCYAENMSPKNLSIGPF